jgi:hypothetical protein
MTEWIFKTEVERKHDKEKKTKKEGNLIFYWQLKSVAVLEFIGIWCCKEVMGLEE